MAFRPRPVGAIGAVLATQETLDMMRLRYGDNFAGSTQAVAYGEKIKIGDVTIQFHPAGHVLGSAQIAVSCKDTRIVRLRRLQGRARPHLRAVRTGSLRCVHHRQATFGLPGCFVRQCADEIRKLLASVRAVSGAWSASVGRLFAGKAQAVIAAVACRRLTTRRSICTAR